MKKSYRERYKRISDSKFFKEHYEDKSIGEVIEVPPEIHRKLYSEKAMEELLKRERIRTIIEIHKWLMEFLSENNEVDLLVNFREKFMNDSPLKILKRLFDHLQDVSEEEFKEEQNWIESLNTLDYD